MNSNNIPEKVYNEILEMQSDLRIFFEVNYDDNPPIPFNIHRIGVFIKDEGKAVDVGYFNYQELISLHTYIDINYNIKHGKLSILDHIACVGNNPQANQLSEDAYKAELSMITWLGSNVGQAFLSRFNKKIQDFNDLEK